MTASYRRLGDGVKYGYSNPRKPMDKIPSRFLSVSLRNPVKLLMC